MRQARGRAALGMQGSRSPSRGVGRGEKQIRANWGGGLRGKRFCRGTARWVGWGGSSPQTGRTVELPLSSPGVGGPTAQGPPGPEGV